MTDRVVVVKEPSTVVKVSAPGPRGPAGAQGPQGLDGPTGPDGLQGPQGIQGPAGADGAQGPAGPQGLQGDPGPQGATGPAGADGPQGPQGIQGIQGPQGDVGPQGPTGVIAATAPATYDAPSQTVGVTVGTTAGTVAAGDDSRITGAAQKAANLSDLASAATARGNLGLGSAATVNTGIASGQVPLLGTGGRLDIARVASGVPDGTQFVRDDGTLAKPGGSGSVSSAKVNRTVGPQSIASGVDTVVTWDTEVWDTDTMVDLASHASRVAITAGAKYRVTGSLAWDANGTGKRYAWVAVNGSGTAEVQDARNSFSSGAKTLLTFSVELSLAAGDYIEVWASQDSGSALNLSADRRNFLSVSAI